MVQTPDLFAVFCVEGAEEATNPAFAAGGAHVDQAVVIKRGRDGGAAVADFGGPEKFAGFLIESDEGVAASRREDLAFAHGYAAIGASSRSAWLRLVFPLQLAGGGIEREDRSGEPGRYITPSTTTGVA